MILLRLDTYRRREYLTTEWERLLTLEDASNYN